MVHSFPTRRSSDLLFGVLVEEKVERIKRRPGYLPVVLFVHVPECDGVAQNLVERLDTRCAHVVRERQRVAGEHAEGLDFSASLPDDGLGSELAWCGIRRACSGHGSFTSLAVEHGSFHVGRRPHSE